MKLVTLFLIVIGLISNLHAQQKQEVFQDENSKLNYSVGYQIGSDFKQQEFEVQPEAVLKGIQDAMSDADSLMSRQEMQQTMADMGKKVAELKKVKRQQITRYEQQNRQFLVDNAKIQGVTTTASGLQYRVVEAGSGDSPDVSDRVLVHYRGKLINGTEFDSSYKRKKPANFKVNQVIKGWTEALQLMPRGSHWQLYIPSELAYGEKGAGPSIPPNSTLIFDVELISIQ